MKYEVNFYFTYGYTIVTAPFVEKVIMNYFCVLVENQSSIYMWVYFWILSSVPLMYLSVFTRQNIWLDFSNLQKPPGPTWPYLSIVAETSYIYLGRAWGIGQESSRKGPCWLGFFSLFLREGWHQGSQTMNVWDKVLACEVSKGCCRTRGSCRWVWWEQSCRWKGLRVPWTEWTMSVELNFIGSP